MAWHGTTHAASSTLTVQATVLSRSNCRFDTNRSTLNFGTIDAAGSSDVTATVAVSYVCRGSAPVATFAFSQDDGRYASGSGNPRMRHAADPSAFLPYSLSLNPSSGTVPKNVHQDLAVTGTVRAVDYRAAAAGNYSDTVTRTILP